MPLQEFWNDDPDLLWVYRTSYLDKIENKTELQREIINFQAWLQGFYNFNAIASAFSKNLKYFEKPIELDKKEENLSDKIIKKLMKSKEYIEQRREEKGR